MLSSAFVPYVKCLHHNQTPIPRFSTLSLIIPLKRSVSHSFHPRPQFAIHLAGSVARGPAMRFEEVS